MDYISKANEYASAFKEHGTEIESRAAVGYMTGYQVAIADAAKVARTYLVPSPQDAFSRGFDRAAQDIVTAIFTLASPARGGAEAKP